MSDVGQQGAGQQPDAAQGDGPEGGQRGGADSDRVVIVTQDGMGVASTAEDEDGGERNPAELVEQPAKVMRIGSMIKQLLDEVRVRAARPGRPRPAGGDPRALDHRAREGPGARAGGRAATASRCRSATDETPSDAELRIAQAQLVGWLEGLFHGIQTALMAQQMAARAQLEEMRRALPMGHGPGMSGQPGQQGHHPMPGMPGQGQPGSDGPAQGTGQYL